MGDSSVFTGVFSKSPDFMRVCWRTRLTETDRRNHVINRRRKNSKSSCPQGHVGSNPTRSATSLRTAYRSQRLFTKVASHSFCRSSSPNRTRFAGLRFGFLLQPRFSPALRRAHLFHRFQKAQEGRPALRRALVHTGVFEHLRKHQPGLTAHYVHDVLRRDVVFCAEALGPVRVL